MTYLTRSVALTTALPLTPWEATRRVQRLSNDCTFPSNLPPMIRRSGGWIARSVSVTSIGERCISALQPRRRVPRKHVRVVACAYW